MPDCIIPAAGRSRRMGRWKAGLPWDGDTILGKVTSEAVAAGCRTCVVGGYRHAELERLLADRKELTVLRNPRWERGMDTTIKAALGWIRTDWFFVIPVDMPMVSRDDYRRLAEAAEISSGIDFIRPIFRQSPGHPVLINSSMIADLAALPDGTPFRQILGRYRSGPIEWDHDGVIRDLDTSGEYESIRRAAGRPLK